MKMGTRRIFYTIIAVLLALGLGIGAILLSMLNVQASTEMMPGIEQILEEKSSETPFRILELVNNSADAEIGYYISGQEPYLTQYKYTSTNADGSKRDTQTFSSVEEGLSVLPTKEERQKFVEATDEKQVKNPLKFAWNADAPGTTSEADYPLSFKSYAEKYFLSKTDDATKWNRVDFKNSRKETLTGHYEENASGKGDYTKEEQKYYPIREDVTTDGSTTQKYRENIKNFFYSDDTEASAPYHLSFEAVSNDEVNASLKGDGKEIEEAYNYNAGGFGYYENVYGELTSEIVKNITNKKYTFPGENPMIADSSSDDTSDASGGDNRVSGNSSKSDADATDTEDVSDAADTENDTDTNEIDIADTDDTIGGEDDGTAERADVTSAGTQENPYIYRGENIDEHPYYKYTLLGDLKSVKEKAEKDSAKPSHEDGDITVEDGQYWYWTAEGADAGDNSESGNNGGSGTGTNAGADVTLKKEALYIVTGRQAVSESQVKTIPEDFTYDYYYKVKSVDYCCKRSADGKDSEPDDYTYYGWYYASHPSNEDVYIEVKDNTADENGNTDDNDTTDGTTDADKLAAVLNYTATHYISEAQYTLTPGKGNYDFVEGTGTKDKEQSVELDHLFYQGGYTNHDWFKHYVFHLDPNSKDETIQKQFKNLSIKVDTKVINTNGTGTEASELPNLNDYDLVYINGELSSKQALDIAATTKLPAIINQKTAMGTEDDKSVMEKAFAAYVDEEYSKVNSSYVSERIYFTDGDLCNLNFHADFSKTEEGAFSEITDYINSENNYREVVESGEQGEKTAALDTNISQARVIEYIINYKYKREKAYKSSINILDIEPASATASLTEDTVRKWLGTAGRGTVVDKCCEETSGEGTSNGRVAQITDGDENTYWHSRYSSNSESGPHWFKYEMPEVADIKGFTYTPRPKTNGDGGLNGRPYVLKIELYDKQNNVILTESHTLANNYSDISSMTKKTENFKAGIVKNVKFIKVTFEQTYPSASKFATCAEFSPVYADGDTSNTEINITHMTSSEFVGHIDDINTEYDAIYFGDSYNNWNFLRNGDVKVGENENTTGQQIKLYAHTGGVFGGTYDRSYYDQDHNSWVEGAAHNRWIATRLMGLLDIDYAKDDNGKFITSDGKNLLRSPNSAKEEIGKKIGRMLGSGNDITAQQVRELKDFVSSGYPIIIGNKLLNADGKSVDTNVVDSSSYIYEFLNDAISNDKVNVMSKSEADKKENLNFFFYLAKPEINFTEMPKEPKRLNDSSYTYNKEAKIGNLEQDEDGLKYEFTIKNDSELSTASATYNCELFIDLNFDGNLSSSEEQSEYMQIQDSSGNVVQKKNGKYHLKVGKSYVLTRKIPKDYYKVITWKIQISNNANSSIRTSRMGFTKRTAGKQQEIHVLQIYPESHDTALAPVTWHLSQDDTFTKMLEQVTDFKITITEMRTDEYEKAFKEAKNQEKNLLDQYQMIIIGFADGFGKDNIENGDGAVDAIGDFIKDGKSVIFSHDTTSFVNTTNVKRATIRWKKEYCLYNPNTWPSLDEMPTAWDWGYSLNTYLRASVGMDRYGITSDEAITVNGKASTVGSELRKGNDLTKNDGVYEAIKEKVSDMAYVFGNKNTVSFMAQGFTNNVLDNNDHTTKNASKVNEGAITQYPYHVADTIETAETHSQYYQLALEEDDDKDGSNDVVVWYCLANGADSYKNSPNDVRNNYYFYSKGNVIYTGVGHKAGNTEEERQLFANAVIAAANVTAVDPEATFLDDFDPVSNQEDYRYYMPDRLKASEVSGTNILEGDNTFNIRIRDYNMVAANLNNKSNNSGSLTMELYIDDPDSKDTIKINGTDKKVRKISVEGKTDDLKKYSDGKTIHVDNKGVFKLPGNDTFQFSLKDMESYLKNADGTYRKECNIYAKVESTVTLYGTTANKVTWTSISLKPRQLFDLD